MGSSGEKYEAVDVMKGDVCRLVCVGNSKVV